MTTIRPTSIDELAHAVTTHPRLTVRGGGTKPALASAAPDVTVLDMRDVAGIVEYQAAECTFTARAGTPLAEIERALAPHGQHLPFDPPLADAGATLGGAVASGVNGSCRYRFGGIRDFVIGARIVDGRGQLITSGGKVVKNAASFLLHQALVGSCGTLGVIAELTFKVFPAAEAHATVRVDAGDIAAAVTLVNVVERARFDLEAIDIEAPGTVWIRLGGFREALSQRVRALEDVLRGAASASRPSIEASFGDADAAVWQAARGLSWATPGWALVRVPTTLRNLVELDAALAGSGAVRRYPVAGNVALVAWPSSVDDIGVLLRDRGLVGQVLRGATAQRFVGATQANPFATRLKAVLDPDGRF